jgi:Rrf2 family protein
MEYSLRSLIELALSREAGLSGAMVAERSGISPSFLKQILSLLVKEGLVESQRGRQGRYHVGKNPAELTLLEILECVEGELPANFNGAHWGSETQKVLDGVEHDLRHCLMSVTLETLTEAARIDRKKADPMFYI